MSVQKRFILAAVIGALIVMGVSAVHGFSLTGVDQLTVTCTGVIDNGAFGTANRDNTGIGDEAYVFRAFDGAGTLIHEFSNQVPVGFGASVGSFSFNITTPAFNPITVEFISLAGNSLPEQVVFRIQGECAGLPFFNPPSNPPAEQPCIDIPDGSVVGRLTRTAQVFYAPGQQSPGLMLEAGKAFWVIGYDETRQYVKIVLACEYLWVEADAIGPDFDAPWLGQPLPDRIVQ